MAHLLLFPIRKKHKVRLLSAFHLLFLSCNPKSPFKVVEEFDAGLCEMTVDSVTDILTNNQQEPGYYLMRTPLQI